MIALALVSISACSSHESGQVTEAVRPAYVSSVLAGGAGQVAYIGEVRASQRAELAFASSGRVVAVLVEVGERVRAGQVLARIDEQPLQAQLSAAMADVARAEAQLTEIRLRNERLKIAQEAGAASTAELTGIRAELASCEAMLRTAQAQLTQAKWSLENASLKAPLDGVVATRTIEAGQTAGPGMPVITLDGAGRELSLLLPARQRIQPGQTIELQGDAGTASSKVLRVGGRVEAGGLRRVFLTVPENALVGSTWSAMLGQAEQRAALQVPLRAVLPGKQSGEGQVLRLAADRKSASLPLAQALSIGEEGCTTELVPVRLGALRGDWVEVQQGLKAGDRVVVAGAAGIRPGSLVKPVAYTGAGGQP